MAAAGLVLSAAACSPDEAGEVRAAAHLTTADRGDLLSARPVARLSAGQARAQARHGGYDDAGVRNGVDAYRVRYRTIDPHGRPTTASGLVALPITGARRLRAVVYSHGTTSERKEVASRWTDPYEYGPALVYAGAGSAAVLPDYLGLGDGPGNHPWFDLPSETTAGADLLVAADHLVRREHRTLRRGVHVTGFSQGASAAMGLARALQRGEVGRFGVHALAPISGAYDFAGSEIPAILDGRVEPHNAVAYTTYLLVAWSRLHHLDDDLSALLRAPYAARAARLFDGTTPGAVMIRSLPGSVRDLLTPRGLRLLGHPTGRFAQAMRVADAACSWRPQAPTRLYLADADEQAVNANTAACRRDLHRHGADVPAVWLGTPDALGSRHLGSNVAGVAATARWFASLG